jgi:obg-like ATPase 1
MGIVGLPNVGKSTFFNLLCNMNVSAENYPFCTIDPNVSKVAVPDERFDHLVALNKPKSVVPAVLTVTDIAGLVKGAAEGAGLGNAFLSHIAAVDGIFHVCRAFGGTDVTHVEGEVDPVRDLEIIHNELRLKDIATVAAKLETMKKAVDGNRGGKELKEEYVALGKVLDALKAGKDVRDGEAWGNVEVEAINRCNLITAKPMVYLVNLSEKDYVRKSNKFLPKLAEWLKAHHPDDKMLPFSCEFEAKWVDMSPADREAYAKDNGGAKSSMPRIIKIGYHALNLCHFFTAGADEVRAWTIKVGTPAPAAAGVIHTDIQKNFIAAEIYAFDDLKEAGTEVKVREAGKYHTKGKLYEIADGDVCFFKHGA